MLRATLRAAVPGWGVASALLLPFLGKAFTIDDTLFLRQAEHALVDPLHPAAFPIVWTDVTARVSQIMPSGPIMPWLLMPAVHFGGAEWVAHAVQLVLLLVAIAATVRIAFRLGLDERGARAAGLVIATTPAVLGMAATAMPDVAAMTFGALGMERWLAYQSQRRLGQALTAAVLLTLAALARSHLLLLVGVCGLFLYEQTAGRLWERLSRLFPEALPLLLPPLGMVVIARLTADPEAGSNIADATRGLTRLLDADRRLGAFFIHYLLALPLLAPWLILRGRAVRYRRLYVLLPACLLWALIRHGAEALLIGPLLSLSLLAALDLGGILYAAPHGLALLAWLGVAAPIAMYVHLPSKYLLASAPAVAVLIARLLVTERVAAARSMRRRCLFPATLAVGALLGVLIVRADARFAGLGRQAAHELVAPHVRAGKRVYLAAHWGFQWYAERDGGVMLTRGARPQPGELIVHSAMSAMELDDALAAVPRLTLVAEVTDQSLSGRIMSLQSRAGFFSEGWGILPWSLGSSPVDRYTLWQVR